jgi:uncharacterized protein
MKEIYTKYIASELGVALWQVEQCADLLAEGATIPFISRYRKERTGGLDENGVARIKYYSEKFEELERRKETVLSTIAEAGALTPELEKEISACIFAKDLEDLYLPYRPKRKTRASVAKEKGLEPFAKAIFGISVADPYKMASHYVDAGKGVSDAEEALSGASDIVSEWISEMKPARDFVRSALSSKGILSASLSRKGADADKDGKYANYYDFSEPLHRIAPHRLLAVLRAEAEGVLSVKVEADAVKICNKIEYDIFKAKRFPSKALAPVFRKIVEDSYRRLLLPSLSSEVIREAKERADLASVELFGSNLRQLLLAPPLGEKRVMGVDPGFRTGCKVVCLDESGKLLADDVIYPHPPRNERIVSMKKILSLVAEYSIEAVAIGNGTAGRETEMFFRKLGLPPHVEVFSVSEDGASVYSASDIAREEFPDYDLTVRGAVSIGRRLMDPLAELVKIDPKSIGVGQYQHDVDQSLLKERLDDVVMSCVNSVGVNLNTAGKYLLMYVSGIGPALADNIVGYREEHGPFRSRRELLSVSRLGAKAFEQCAGFLRIRGGDDPLDDSAVHPESYGVVRRMASDLGVGVSQLIRNEALINKIVPENYVSGSVGLPTVEDIIKELSKPGLDPRSGMETVEFDGSIGSIDDLSEGMELDGIVTNITAFGAFVDIGIKQNGLIHVSRMAGRPLSSLKIRGKVRVRVIGIDSGRGRISLELLR